MFEGVTIYTLLIIIGIVFVVAAGMAIFMIAWAFDTPPKEEKNMWGNKKQKPKKEKKVNELTQSELKSLIESPSDSIISIVKKIPDVSLDKVDEIEDNIFKELAQFKNNTAQENVINKTIQESETSNCGRDCKCEICQILYSIDTGGD